MTIRIKGIWHERTEDAPFIGALISSVDCNYNCKNCFNQHIKDCPTIITTTDKILDEVQGNPFNTGIILAGLEWTLQPSELEDLIIKSIERNLSVILYTGMNETDFKATFPIIYNQPIYFKFGRYDEHLSTDNYVSCGVRLASSNQYIVKKESR